MDAVTRPGSIPPVISGLAGARARWGPPRNLRLDRLTPAQRQMVAAVYDAAIAENVRAAAQVRSTEAAGSEGHANDRPTS